MKAGKQVKKDIQVFRFHLVNHDFTSWYFQDSFRGVLNGRYHLKENILIKLMDIWVEMTIIIERFTVK